MILYYFYMIELLVVNLVYNIYNLQPRRVNQYLGTCNRSHWTVGSTTSRKMVGLSDIFWSVRVWLKIGDWKWGTAQKVPRKIACNYFLAPTNHIWIWFLMPQLEKDPGLDRLDRPCLLVFWGCFFPLLLVIGETDQPQDKMLDPQNSPANYPINMKDIHPIIMSKPTLSSILHFLLMKGKLIRKNSCRLLGSLPSGKQT